MMKHNMAIVWACALVLFLSCEENHIPKPLGLLKVELPDNTTYTYQDSICPFRFEIAKYAFVNAKDSVGNVCHKNIFMPTFNAVLYASYLPLFDNLNENAAHCQKLAYEHRVKANAIEEIPLHFPEHNVHGLMYKIDGNVASNFQFYLTDSTKHFFRGSLYFNSRPNSDSLKPYLDFVVKDLEKMISSFEWK
jgi:gliding motility-associated lipoprotein GldD